MKVQSCMLILLCTLQAHGWNCFKNCRTKKPTHLPTPSTCLNPPVLGYCNPLLEAWHYDHNKGRCTKVNPSLCGTGKNLFGKESHCLQACSTNKSPKAVCSLEPIAERCLLTRNHWYFDKTKNRCFRFRHGKCAKNRNGFRTLVRCMERCSYFLPTTVSNSASASKEPE
ncbi:BPTI/Kunitz domain-containing protein-like isoform X2 [Rhipicephalus microplus]|uniref:BPTI/Kunitz domain-containing protein-like isoform X2 n=1 Tax=Rhipicephalus microplus TaxID=6941 RepID=UPI003F6BE066